MKYFGIVCLICFIVTQSDRAWGQYPRYTPPAGRTLPNALNYFRGDVGVLDPYNAFVEPRRRLDRDLMTLQSRQQIGYRENQAEIAALRASAAAPTGTSASFFNYSHYYSSPTSRPRR